MLDTGRWTPDAERWSRRWTLDRTQKSRSAQDTAVDARRGTGRWTLDAGSGQDAGGTLDTTQDSGVCIGRRMLHMTLGWTLDAGRWTLGRILDAGQHARSLVSPYYSLLYSLFTTLPFPILVLFCALPFDSHSSPFLFALCFQA